MKSEEDQPPIIGVDDAASAAGIPARTFRTHAERHGMMKVGRDWVGLRDEVLDSIAAEVEGEKS